MYRIYYLFKTILLDSDNIAMPDFLKRKEHHNILKNKNNYRVEYGKECIHNKLSKYVFKFQRNDILVVHGNEKYKYRMDAHLINLKLIHSGFWVCLNDPFYQTVIYKIKLNGKRYYR